ncbi:hypothetical protein [Pseudomonas sp. TCU-HL1]|uniref:hypothetical protein n=1 Tax=Pseudomonas sp. TCU-HL1 TaxID=1856685 RepID=UPI0011AB50EB|nr:hypothetical protein [Pseudomonas sp. TCU-HL1]
MHTLADLAHCMHTGCALARWYERRKGQARGTQPNKKWIAFFRGSLPRGRLREELCEWFPELRQLLNNSLWLSLVADPQQQIDWDALVDNDPDGYRLRTYNRARLDAFVACPEWSRLGALLMLLRTRTGRFGYFRLWARGLASAYIQMVCARPPLDLISRGLYDRISTINAEYVPRLIEGWPDSKWRFRRTVWCYRVMAVRAVLNGVVPDRVPGGQMLLWIFIEQPDVVERAILMECLLRFTKREDCPALPEWVRLKLREARRAYARTCQLHLSDRGGASIAGGKYCVGDSSVEKDGEVADRSRRGTERGNHGPCTDVVRSRSRHGDQDSGTSCPNGPRENENEETAGTIDAEWADFPWDDLNQ